MAEVTQILASLNQADSSAAQDLLPLVYEELRRLAAQRLAQEKPGQTLQATALVHEAYLRLVGNNKSDQAWENRGHFFAAAAEAMRRILVENARRRQSLKRGGQQQRIALDEFCATIRPDEEILEVHDALTQLAKEDATAAAFVQLRYFAGMTAEEAAELLGISRSAAFEHWAYAKARLHGLLNPD